MAFATGINAPAIGGLSGTANFALDDSAATGVALTVGNNNATTTYTGVMSDAGVVGVGGSLIKAGSGNLTLTGANTYTGGTTVGGTGALYANNTTGSATGPGAVGVQSGAILGGSGSIAGTVTVASGGILAPHITASGANTLTVGALVTSSGTTNFNFNVTSTTVSDAITVTGNLNLTGSTNNLALSFPNTVFPAAPVAGTYKVLNYTTETATNYAFNTSSSPVTYLYSVSDNLAGSYVLTTIVNTATWTGTSSTAWDTGSTNWTDPAPNVSHQFATGQPAIFDDTAGSGHTTVVIQALGVSPFSTTFNNNLLTYNVSNLSGAVGITGTGGVIVNGPGTVNFNSQNTYSGGNFLNGGTLAITADNALGNAASSPATNLTFNGGTLAFNGAGITLGVNRSVSILAGGATFNLDGNTAIIAGSISGTVGGSLTETGTGTLLLSSTTNTYNGNTVVAGGTLQAVSGGLPTTTSLIIGGVSGSPTFDLHAVSQQVAGLSDNGSFTNGTVTNSGTAAILTVAPASNSSNTFSGVIQNGSSSVSLTVNGTGTQVLAGANTFTGPTTVTAGTLNLSNALALQNSTLSAPTVGNVVFDKSVGANAFTVGGLTGAGNIALQNNAASPAPVTLSVGNNNASTTFNGVLSGSGSLTKVGTGTLALNTVSTYGGATTISGGTLQLQGTLTLPSALVSAASYWLNSSTLSSVVNGGAVTSWVDSSGHGINFTGTATYAANAMNGQGTPSSST